MHAVAAGAGPTIVLLHPEPGDASTFAAVIPRLADGYRVLALDLRGHGASAKPRGDYSVATQAVVRHALPRRGGSQAGRARREQLRRDRRPAHRRARAGAGPGTGAVGNVRVRRLSPAVERAPAFVLGRAPAGTRRTSARHRARVPGAIRRPVTREHGTDRRGAGRVHRSEIPSLACGNKRTNSTSAPSSRCSAASRRRRCCCGVGTTPQRLLAGLAASSGTSWTLGSHSSTTAATIRHSSSPRRSAATRASSSPRSARSEPDALGARFRSRRRGARTPRPTARGAGHRGTARRCAAGRSHPTRSRSAGSASNAQTSCAELLEVPRDRRAAIRSLPERPGRRSRPLRCATTGRDFHMASTTVSPKPSARLFCTTTLACRWSALMIAAFSSASSIGTHTRCVRCCTSLGSACHCETQSRKNLIRLGVVGDAARLRAGEDQVRVRVIGDVLRECP